MTYYNEKRKKIAEIESEIQNLNITQLEDVLSVIKSKKPLNLKDFIKKEFDDREIGGIGCKDINNQAEVRQAFEHEVRAICLKLGPDFKKIKTKSQYIDHFCEMYVEGYDLDIWIQEHCPLFNPSELAFIIYLLYTEEVIF